MWQEVVGERGGGRDGGERASGRGGNRPDNRKEVILYMQKAITKITLR